MSRGRLTSLGIACIAALSACAPASASMTVTATGDGGGACTLREAIEAVNAADSGSACGTLDGGVTTINLPGNNYTPTTGQLVVTGSMAIVGADESSPAQTVIDAGAHGRVFEVKIGGQLKLTAVEITGGRTADAPTPPDIYHAYPVEPGGGILNHGSLTLDHALLTENRTGSAARGINGALEGPGGSGGEGGPGGGIYNDGSLTIVKSTISKNFTGNGGDGGTGGMGGQGLGHFPNGSAGGDGGWAGDGGGIYNAGTAVIEGSTIDGNFTGRGGNGGQGGQGAGESEFGAGTGGDGGDGGNGGKQYRKDQALYLESDRGGGGIYNLGSLTMSNSTISGNAAGAGGNGGVSGYGGEQKSGTFRVSGRAGTGGGGGRGGGLLSGGGGISGHSPATLINVTIYGNRTGDGGTGGAGGGGADNTLGGATGGWGGDGGGIWVQGARSGSAVTLNHVTIAGNGLGAAGPAGSSANPQGNAPPGGRGAGAGVATGGRYDGTGSGLYEKNSIIAGNGSNASGDLNCNQAYPPPTYIDIVDQGGNVTWNDTSCPGMVADPKLGPLANNGGLTQTLMPESGSSAIGAVPSASCTLHEDQRGLPRPGGSKTNCDAGAVETQTGGPSGGGEEKGGEQPGGTSGGGGNSGAANPGGPPPSTPKAVKCRKGFKKTKVNGKTKCVKVKKPQRHRHHKH